MSAQPEIVDFSSHPDLEWAANILAKAKQLMVEHNGQLFAVLFMRTPFFGDQMIRVGTFADFNDERQKEAVAYAMKETAKVARPTAVAFLSDTFVHLPKPPYRGILDRRPELWAKWKKNKARYFDSREAIVVNFESYDLGSRLLVQFYKRIGKGKDMRIEFQECETNDFGTDGGGRMQGFLPRREGQ